MAKVEGKTVNVGDYVCFKSDIEQGGTIIRITRDFMGRDVLTLYSEYGFEGGYIGGQDTTQELAQDCWL